MVVHVDISHICGFVPLRFSRHIIRNQLAVDGEVLETDVFHLAALVVTSDDTHVRSFSSVGDVAQGDVLDATSWGRTVLLVEAYAHVEKRVAQIVDISLGTCCPLHGQWLPVSCSPAPHHVFPEGPLDEHGRNAVSYILGFVVSYI